MDELIKKYPEFAKTIQDIYKSQSVISKYRQIKVPRKPTGNSSTDLPIQFKHFLNVIHLKFQSQINYFVLGLESQNPETFSTARNCMETIGSLVYVSDEIQKKIKVKNFVGARKILYRATMGENKKQIEFLKLEPVTDPSKSAINVMNYIDRVDDLAYKTFGVLEKKDKYFRSQYDALCERTHPNYSALSMLWGVENDKFQYQLPAGELRTDDFGLVIHIISPLIPMYLMFMKRAQELEIQLQTT